MNDYYKSFSRPTELSFVTGMPYGILPNENTIKSWTNIISVHIIYTYSML